MKNSIEEQMFSIEQSYSVESIEYKGVKLWPFLRTMIHYSKLKTQYVQSSQVFCDKFFRALKIMNEHLSGVLLTNFSLFKKNKSSILFTTNYQMYKENGEVLNRLMNNIERYVGEFTPVLQINMSKEKGMYKNRYVNERLINDKISLRAKKITLQDGAIKGEKELLDIFKELDISFDYKSTIPLIIAGIDYYTEWFEKILPRCLIIECYYDIKMCASYAAKKLGIPTIEIQHGTITERSFEYNSKKEIVDNPYPEWLFTYGQAEKDSIGNHNVYKKDKIIPIGSYWVEKKKNMDVLEINSCRDKYNNDIIVAVIGQLTVDDKLTEIVKRLSKRDKKITYVYVPRVIEKKYKKMVCENIYIEEELDVYTVMRSSDVVLMVYSTCGLESIALGTPVVIADINGLGTCYYGDIARKVKNIRIAVEEADIINAIRFSKNAKRGEVTTESNYYFHENHDESVKKAIKIVLGDKK